MNRLQWLLALSVVPVIAMTGCVDHALGQGTPISPARPSPISGESREIVSRVMSAMDSVKSYRLDTDVVNEYEVLSTPDSYTTTYEWKGSRLIDLRGRQMTMTMHISGYDYVALEMHIERGWQYLNSFASGSYGTVNPWDKTKLTDKIWAAESQISFYAEFLRTATQASVSGNESVNGVDCLVLDVTPSIQAAIDWVISQEQPRGPQLDVMYGGGIPVVRTDAYQSGRVRLWIDKANFLPLRAQANAVFAGNVGGGPMTSTPYTPTTNPVNSSFSGEATFSDYNQPVSIQLPEQAIGAKER
jgi:hypothetical protein